MSKPLYEITNELRDFLDNIEIDEETGELLNVEGLDELQLEYANKLEGVACFIKEQEALEEAIAQQIKNFQARKKSIDSKIEWMKNYIKVSMEAVGQDKFENVNCKLSFRKSTSTEVPEDASLLPPEYQKIETVIKADKTKIKDALKEGIVIEGCSLVENKNLQIK